MTERFRIGEFNSTLPTKEQVRKADIILSQHGIYTTDRSNVCRMVDKARELDAIDSLRAKLGL